MSRVNLSKHHAVFSDDYVEEGWNKAVRALSNRSRFVRAWFFGLPASRLRMAFVARFFAAMFDDMENGHFENFKSVIHPDAPINLFDLGTYHGPDGWRVALDEWLALFKDALVEVQEFIDVGTGEVVCVGPLAGRGSGSGAEVQYGLAFVIRVEDGMAMSGRAYRTKAEALEAVGLAEPPG